MLYFKLGRLKHDAGFILPLDIEASCDTGAYGYAEIVLAAPLKLKARAENTGGEIRVQGQLTACLTLECSRCGQSFAREVSLPFHEEYSNQTVLPDDEGERDKHAFSGGGIDLTPEVLRELFAVLPMKPLCKPDCRGLCSQCGADLNHEQCGCESADIDPRWQALRDLMNDNAEIKNK